MHCATIRGLMLISMLATPLAVNAEVVIDGSGFPQRYVQALSRDTTTGFFELDRVEPSFASTPGTVTTNYASMDYALTQASGVAHMDFTHVYVNVPAGNFENATESDFVTGGVNSIIPFHVSTDSFYKIAFSFGDFDEAAGNAQAAIGLYDTTSNTTIFEYYRERSGTSLMEWLTGNLTGTLEALHTYRFSGRTSLQNNQYFPTNGAGDQTGEWHLTVSETALSVPEPSSFGLLSLGGLAFTLAMYRRRHPSFSC